MTIEFIQLEKKKNKSKKYLISNYFLAFKGIIIDHSLLFERTVSLFNFQ